MGSLQASGVEDFYRSARVRLVRLGYLLTGSPELAEELVHDAFVRSWDRLGHVEDPRAYLRTVVMNLARAHHRRTATARKHPPEPPGPALNPETDEMWSLLWQLPDRQRTALILRFYGDLDVAGVATALGCRLGTAKSLIHRGLSRLREVIVDE